VALVAIGSTLLIAACGSSGSSSAAASGGANPAGIADFLKFSQCMRSHGVPDFPDPSAGGGIHLSPGTNALSPAFKAAQVSCHKLLPGGGPGADHPTAQAKTQMLEVSVCMRRHGISGFPDPTLSPPSGAGGYSTIIDRGGVVLAIPDTINAQSPAFKQAAAVCKFSQ
jgi:hypothetical protein